MKRHSILFVEQHRSTEKRLLPGLVQHYDVVVVRARREVMTHMHQASPDLVLVDVPTIRFDLPRFCDDLRAHDPETAIFFLLSKGMRLDQMPRTNGYLRHPFTMRQLLRRLARTLPEHRGEVVSWDGLQLDTEGHFLMWEGKQIPLTPKQALLTSAFLKAPNETLSRAQLMQDVWGTDYLGDTRTLDVHIHWLRKALKQLRAPLMIETERGVGYRLVSTADPEVT